MGVVMLPDLRAVRRVLIIRGSAIGDVLHATPLAAALKSAYPHLEITWITEEICGDVVLGNPYLDEVIVVPRSRWKQGRLRSPRVWREYLAFLSGLRARNFDVSIDLQGYAKSAILALASGARYRLGWWRMRDGANLVSRSLPKRESSIHRVDWFLDVARELGVADPKVCFSLDIPAGVREDVRSLLESEGLASGQRYVVLNQAAGDQARRWTEAGYAEVAWQFATRHGLRSVLVGVEKDQTPNASIIARYRQFREASDAPGAVGAIGDPIDLAGKTGLKQLFALIEGCALQVSGDTGSLHIAAALGRPVVALFGSSDPAHAGPWGQLDHVISHRDLCDSSCTVRRCASQHFEPGNKSSIDNFADDSSHRDPGDLFATSRCLVAISPAEVMQVADSALAGQGLSSTTI